MNWLDLVRELHAAGIKLRPATPGKAVMSGGTPPLYLRKAMAEHRDVILEYLDERVGVRQYDGGQAEDEAGRGAWDDLLQLAGCK